MRLILVVLGLTWASWIASPVAGQTRWGPEVGYGGGIGPGVGAGILIPLGPALEASEGFLSRLQVGGVFDYYFAGEDFTARGSRVEISQRYWDLTARALYPFETEGSVLPYVGGGLSIGSLSDATVQSGSASAEFPTGDTEIGLNLLGGIRFDEASIPFYLELRASTLRLDKARGEDTSGLFILGGVLLGGDG